MPNRIPTFRPGARLQPQRPTTPARDALPGRKSKLTSDRRWRAFRLAFLAGQPLCVDCKAEGRVEAATEVHHLVKRSTDPGREHWFDQDACAGLCKSCHSRRTARGE